MKIQTKFELGERVVMKPFESEGEICNITFDKAGMNYKVRYVVNSEFKYEWFYEDELEKASQKKMGFND